MDSTTRWPLLYPGRNCIPELKAERRGQSVILVSSIAVSLNMAVMAEEKVKTFLPSREEWLEVFQVVRTCLQL